MKDEMTLAIEEEVAKVMEVLGEIFKMDIEPLLDFGSPEKVLEKKYEEWSPEDFQKASFIFSEKLESFIANKEVKSMQEAESTEV